VIFVVLAHPYLDHSRANAALARAIDGVDGVEVHALYDRYPDFAIDVEAEKRALAACSTVVWQHPLYWYAPPALMKLWFEKVLQHGWAYGPGGTALRGKRCLWVVTTGGDDEGYQPSGVHRYRFETFVPMVRQTAQFCGMAWLEPIIVHGAHRLEADELAALGARYRARLEGLRAEEGAGDA
jgi:glutathione-regulated potassium-efflux system ancillary protein KefF